MFKMQLASYRIIMSMEWVCMHVTCALCCDRQMNGGCDQTKARDHLHLTKEFSFSISQLYSSLHSADLRSCTSDCTCDQITVLRINGRRNRLMAKWMAKYVLPAEMLLAKIQYTYVDFHVAFSIVVWWYHTLLHFDDKGRNLKAHVRYIWSFRCP